jgi:hypothetical protein
MKRLGRLQSAFFAVNPSLDGTEYSLREARHMSAVLFAHVQKNSDDDRQQASDKIGRPRPMRRAGAKAERP